jgi:hypothetical protein
MFSRLPFMRRLVLEILEEELNELEKDMPLQKIKSFEVLHMLRFDREEFAHGFQRLF